MNRRGVLGFVGAAAFSPSVVLRARAQTLDPVVALTECIDHHRRYRACFASKFRTGYCDFKGFDGKATTPDGLMRMLAIAGGRLAMLSLDRRTAALLYHVRDDGMMDVFLLDETGPTAWERTGGEVAALIDGLRADLKVETRAVTRAAVPLARKKQQAEAAVPPADIAAVSKALLPGTVGRGIAAGGFERLLVLASGAVGQAPFPALALPGGRQLVDQASVVLLADPEALFMDEDSFPSLEMAVEALTFSLRDALSGPKLLVGNPAFGKVEGWSLPPLPGAEAEVESVAAELAVEKVLVGKAATQKTIMAALRQMRETGGLAYFATHGVSDAVNPMDGSFLAVAGGVIRGQQIRKLKMVVRHPLVVMSACQSGLGKTFGGGGYGLARAWYAAGAGQVLGSLWNVSDEGTTYLMTRFARAAVGGTTVEDALRLAMRQTRDAFSDDPAIWASFVAFGNPGS